LSNHNKRLKIGIINYLYLHERYSFIQKQNYEKQRFGYLIANVCLSLSELHKWKIFIGLFFNSDMLFCVYLYIITYINRSVYLVMLRFETNNKPVYRNYAFRLYGYNKSIKAFMYFTKKTKITKIRKSTLFMFDMSKCSSTSLIKSSILFFFLILYMCINLKYI
jgi:hypothetical protein